MYKILLIIAAGLFLLSLNACVPSNKLYYFHDQVPSKDTIDTIRQVSAQRIQVNDRMTIVVSSTDPSLTAFLNPFNVQSGTTANANTGYLVNAKGTIEFPLLGTVPVAGLSSVEAAALIKDKLGFYYKDVFVNVNLMGKVYFMSGRSGATISMTNERLTIFEAIAQSGTQDAYDRRNEVWLVREKNSERIYTKLDLNSKKIFLSPYYYLQNNDLIYMQPGKYSSFLSTNSPGRTALTALTAVITIYLAIKNL